MLRCVGQRAVLYVGYSVHATSDLDVTRTSSVDVTCSNPAGSLNRPKLYLEAGGLIRSNSLINPQTHPSRSRNMARTGNVRLELTKGKGSGCNKASTIH